MREVHCTKNTPHETHAWGTDYICSGKAYVRRSEQLDNEILVLGAVWMALEDKDAFDVLPFVAEWDDVAYIDIRLPFMKSAYRVTVTLLPDTEDEPG
jgi:hypothetical protein